MKKKEKEFGFLVCVDYIYIRRFGAPSTIAGIEKSRWVLLQPEFSI